MVGATTLRNFKTIIRHNIIKNCPATVEDTEIAEKVFGTDVSTLKVRTTIKRPKVAVDDFIEILREMIENNQDFILCMYTMFINKKEFFTSIDKDIQFRVLLPLENRTKEEC